MATRSQTSEPFDARDEIEEPDISHIVTEDDAPVDNLYSEKNQRLLTEPLFASWSGPPPGEDGAPRKFLVSANVGLFPGVHVSPLVPDVFLSLDVEARANLWEKRNRTYFFWEFGKAPEVVIEIVSNREGNELGTKLQGYARMGIPYYVVWDPGHHLGVERLHVFELSGGRYVPSRPPVFEGVGVGLVAWEGDFEGVKDVWLRWCLLDGTLVPTGAELARAATDQARTATDQARAATELARAAGEQARAAEEQARDATERERAALENARRLRDKLLALGVDPDGT